ncbi:MAG TPA: AIR synthase related protein [Bacteroidales bacterium]|jgi:thiamine-monophosphate kinase|nr:thiamine-phosphate kinase [Bacteroidales bacterium]MCZ2416662.1 thiamine-phosphate kinase [Burkholderiales bacterium]OQC57485.1 MAG: Thiamine-monophosphate kinase [Bacteroidetes bacterium ADurb.Bin013]MBP8999230.1 thiamine-phosphate kinase [Bacteroidales bacterium]MBV6455456.1 Thiamine-monophosphate kinase [Bacteroidales bacterium]
MSEKKQPPKTPIRELGKYELIDRLSARFISSNEATLQGVGDDASVACFHEALTVSAQKMSLEGVDFDLSYFPLKFIGYKTAIHAMGQVMAMNAIPLQLLVSTGVSQRFFVEDMEELFMGVEAAARLYGADVTAIDIQSSYTGLSVAVTAVGEGNAGLLTRRCGARDTDLICLSGSVGGAYMGLQLLQREKRVFNGEAGKDRLPDLKGHEYILEQYLKPVLPAALLENLRKDDMVPTSMCLLYNGLSNGVLSIAKASGTGAKVYVDKIPIARECFEYAQANGNDPSPLVAALNGGDDFQMLFTLPLTCYETLSKEYTLDIIGHICEAPAGCTLITPGGKSIPLESPGM